MLPYTMSLRTKTRSLWDTLPVELQDLILVKANTLIYSDCMKHFKLVVSSVDARLAAHYFCNKEERYRSNTTVFASTYERDHHYNRYSYRQFNQPESYTELLITLPGDTFGNRNIDSIFDNRGVGDLRVNHNPEALPLIKVLQGLRSRDITIDHVQQLLRLNKVKFLKKDNKGVLIRKFLAIK